MQVSRSRRFRILLIGFLLGAAGFGAAQGPQQAPPPKPTGFLLGTVVDAGTNKPIAGAVVNLGGGGITTTQLPSGEVIQTSAPPGTPGATPVAPRQIIADGAGRFMFRELNQGTYTVRASSPGYLAGVLGENRPNGGPQPILLERDDEKRGGLVLKLWQSGSVSGRVLDELGDAAVGVTLRIVRRTIVAGRPRFAPGLGATTDDRGVYRFSGLTPGDYIVGIFSTATTLPAATADAYQQGVASGSTEMMQEYSMSGAPYPFTSGSRIGNLIFQSGSPLTGSSGIPAPPTDDGRVLAYPTTFYPNAGSAADASVLIIKSGDDRAGIDFQLKLRRTISVSGVVTGPDGRVANIGLKLLPAGADEYATSTTVEAAVTATDSSGAFTFLGVVPGTYTVQCIRVPRTQAPRSTSMTSVEVTGPNGMMMGMSSSGPVLAPALPLPTDPTLWGGQSITIGESDIQNLTILLRPGAKLSGKIVFEGTGEPPPADVLQRTSIQIGALGWVLPSQVSLAQKRVEADGTFRTVGYPPGRYTLSSSIPPLPPGRGAGPAPAAWRFKTATLDGRDLSDEGLDIQGADIAGIVLTFTDRSTEISGSVVDAKSQPDPGAIVVVIPADSQAWKNAIVSPRRVRGVRASTTGTYTIAGLPPGEYFIAAVSDAAMDNWQDPKNLEAISRVSTRITLGDGAKLSQRLTTAVPK